MNDSNFNKLGSASNQSRILYSIETRDYILSYNIKYIFYDSKVNTSINFDTFSEFYIV